MEVKVEVVYSYGTLSHSYEVSLAICDHTVLPASRHKWTHPSLTPARGRYSIYLPRRDGRLSWPRWPVAYRDGLPARRRSPIQELTQQCMHARELNSQPVDHESDALTPSHQISRNWCSCSPRCCCCCWILKMMMMMMTVLLVVHWSAFSMTWRDRQTRCTYGLYLGTPWGLTGRISDHRHAHVRQLYRCHEDIPPGRNSPRDNSPHGRYPTFFLPPVIFHTLFNHFYVQNSSLRRCAVLYIFYVI